MFGLRELKDKLAVTDATVECPVRTCTHRVPRQRKAFLSRLECACPEHQIFISPSTFEYRDYTNNLLWTDPEDNHLLKGLLAVKRESRLAREKSEDAVSWNVLRALEKAGALETWLASLTGFSPGRLKLAYWSCDSELLQTCHDLAAARSAFKEEPRRSSEPDVLAFGDSALVFIEAKFMSGNQTVPTKPQEARSRYTSGGNGWYSAVVSSSFEQVAIDDRLYELLRLWLLGTWAAHRRGVPFFLINLVCRRRECEIKDTFGKHIKASPQSRFLRATWEGAMEHLRRVAPNHAVTARLEDYMRQKTAGYDYQRRIQTAFSIQPSDA